jgi:rRNA maturation endonuclease Nob1
MHPPSAQTAQLVRVIWIVSTSTVVLMAILALAWSIAMVHVYRRDGRWQREGRCLKCGYDLRQSTGVCPECGEPIRGHRADKFHQP